MTNDAGDSLAPRFSSQLAKLLAFAWAAVVAVVFIRYYDAWLRPVLLIQVLLNALPAVHLGSYFNQFWLHRLADAGWCVAVLATAFCVGSILIIRMTRDHDLLTGLFALAAGLWAMAVVVLAISAVAIPRVGWVFALAVCWLHPAPRGFIHKFVWPKNDAWMKLLWVLILMTALLNLAGALTPPFEYDELEYHLGAPSEYIKAGQLVFLPHNFYSNLPQLTEMLYLLGLVTRSDIAPKMLHACFGVLSALAIYSVAARLWSRRIGLTAAALFYCLPFVQDLSQTARIDLATTFFATLAFGGVMLVYDGDRWVWLAALACGAAIATKWTAVAVVFLPALAFLLVTRKSIGLTAGFCAVVAVGILPWLIKNLVLTGNPVYPLLHNLLPNPNWTTNQAALFASKHYANLSPGQWIEIGWRPWQYSFEESGASPVLLMTVPLVLLVRGSNARLRRAGWLFAAAYAGWFLLTFRPWRFLMPAFPLAAALGACALDSVAKWSRALVVAVILIGLSSMGLQLLLDAESPRQPPQVSVLNLLLGQITEHDFLARIVFEPIVWMNDHLPPQARVLYIGEARIQLAHQSLVWATAFDQHPLQSLPPVSEPEKLAAALRARGISYVYVNPSEWRRLRANYGYLKNIDEAAFYQFLQGQAREIHEYGNQSVSGAAVKVGHVITRLIVGGAQENTVATCIGLRRLGYDCDLIIGPQTGPEGSLLEQAIRAGVPIVMIDQLRRAPNPLIDWQACAALRALFKQKRYDIVHTHSGKAGVIGRLAARQAEVPVIVHTIHGPSFYQYQNPLGNWIFRWAERVAGEWTTQFVSVADAMSEQYLAAGIGTPGQYVTIHSGNDAFLQAQPDPQLRASLGIRPDDLVVGKVARLFRLKGHEFLFEAAPQIVSAVPNVKFLLVGDGLYRERFEKRAAALEMRDRFIFAGLVPPMEIPRYMAAMDLLVHLSLREGLPRTLPQALAASRPVVAFDVDGAREVCLDGETGFLLPAGDVTGLAAAVIRLLQDQALAARLGVRGREFVRERFTEERMVQRIDALYRQLSSAQR